MGNSRVVKLRERMRRSGLEAVLIANPVNRRYISGFTGTSGYVLITLEKAVLYTDFRYRTQAPMQAPDFEVIEHRSQAIESVKQTLEQLHISTLGFEQDDLTYGTYLSYASVLDSIRLEPCKGLVEGIRLHKDDSELRILREAADLADQAFTHILGHLKPGVSEREIALEIEFFMRTHGAASTSFDTIVASGERSALPHGVASDRKMGDGELVTLDFGAYYRGYCSDITRTVMIGAPDPRQREIYGVVLEAQLHALDRIRPGMSGKEADALARDVIRRYGYGEHFGHGTGHGVGMEIHEAPRLSSQSDSVLEPGMVVTVEPGIYIPDFGGVRIEDDIVITESGIEILTRSAKELITVT